MASCNWPLMGDRLYGGNRHRGMRVGDALRPVLDGFQRQALHAAELGFLHPDDGRAMRFHADMPADMALLWDAIQAFAS